MPLTSLPNGITARALSAANASAGSVAYGSTPSFAESVTRKKINLNFVSYKIDVTVEDELFDIKNFRLEKNKTDFVARRKTCKNFEKFKPLFERIHEDLRQNKRKLLDFTERDLNQGRFFILEGIMVYVDKVDLVTREFKDKTQGTRKRQDSRIRCIFENGLESNMYFRSLQKLLYKDGKRVSETNVKQKRYLLMPTAR